MDTNTDGYTQWFYFAVRGGSTGLKVTFRLVNMAKSGSLFGTSAHRAIMPGCLRDKISVGCVCLR